MRIANIILTLKWQLNLNILYYLLKLKRSADLQYLHRLWRKPVSYIKPTYLAINIMYLVNGRAIYVINITYYVGSLLHNKLIFVINTKYFVILIIFWGHLNNFFDNLYLCYVYKLYVSSTYIEKHYNYLNILRKIYSVLK